MAEAAPVPADGPVTGEMRLTPAVMAEVQALAGQEMGGPRWKQALVGGGAAFAVIFVMSTLDMPGLLIGFMVGVLVIIVAQWLNMRRWRSANGTRPASQGVTTVTMGPDGVTTEGALARSQYDWRAFPSVAVRKHAVHLQMGGGMTVPVLRDSLSVGPEELVERIETWRTFG